MAKLPCWTNGTTVIKTQDLLIIISMELYVIHLPPGIVPDTMGTQQNLNEWKLGFLLYPGCRGRSRQVEHMVFTFWNVGRGMWIAERVRRIAEFPCACLRQLSVIQPSQL